MQIEKLVLEPIQFHLDEKSKPVVSVRMEAQDITEFLDYVLAVKVMGSLEERLPIAQGSLYPSFKDAIADEI